jgi:hypothetical protein
MSHADGKPVAVSLPRQVAAQGHPYIKLTRYRKSTFRGWIRSNQMRNIVLTRDLDKASKR